MGDSPIFEMVVMRLMQQSGLSDQHCRQTVRVALRDAGLDPMTVTSRQMRVVCKKVLGHHLDLQNIDPKDAESICADLSDLLSSSDLPAPSQQSPESIFYRLDRDGME